MQDGRKYRDSTHSVQIKEKAKKSGSIGTCYPLLWVYLGKEMIRVAALDGNKQNYKEIAIESCLGDTSVNH